MLIAIHSLNTPPPTFFKQKEILGPEVESCLEGYVLSGMCKIYVCTSSLGEISEKPILEIRQCGK